VLALEVILWLVDCRGSKQGVVIQVAYDGSAYSWFKFIYCKNMLVVHNTTAPESMLKKKSNSIAYHSVREAVATGEILIAYIPTDNSMADMMTKVLPGYVVG
jgi:hypothetical protein